MIVPMKKIHMIVQKKDVEPALDELRRLGTVHVQLHSDPMDDQLNSLSEDLEKYKRVIQVLRKVKDNIKQEPCPNAKAIVYTIFDLLGSIDHLCEQIQKQKVVIEQWTRWGYFDPQDIRELEEDGVYVRLCEVPVSNKIEFPDNIVCKKIYSEGWLDRYMLIATEEINCDVDMIDFPEKSLKQLKALQKKEKKKIADAQLFIEDSAQYLDAISTSMLEGVSDFNFREVMLAVRDEESLAVLKGFCPSDAQESLQEKSHQNQWAVLIEEPDAGDQVPTLLRNPKWVDLCKPALKIIEILPGYKEFDVSMIFLLFFTLFFAILIGDAAYGLIFAIITIIAHIKLRKKVEDKTPFYLMYILTTFTIVWGVLTGTFFGQQWLPSTIKPLIPWLNDFTNIQLLCFSIALLHLSIAKIWASVVKFPSVTFLSEVGWLSIIWGMFFVANMFVLGMDFPDYAKYFFYTGIPLAFFFMVEPKNFLKVVGQEIVPFVLNIISAGTDLVSYIRLFAVGLATVAVADATNEMASSAPLVLSFFILIIGHGLNLILALMAILVHAIRLNVLEFSGQLGLQWTGFKYNPFSQVKSS